MIKTQKEFDEILARAMDSNVPMAQRAGDYQSLGRTIIALREATKWGIDIADQFPKPPTSYEGKFVDALNALAPWLTEDEPRAK